MAAPNGSPHRLGADNGAVANFAELNALFHVEFSELILGEFEKRNKALTRFKTRTLTEGSGARFLFTGQSSAAYHTPGTYLTGNSFIQADKTINLDDKLISVHEIAEIDDLKKHWDVKSEMVRKMAYELSDTMDQNILRVALLQARETTANYTGGPVGSTINDADAATNATSLADSIFEAAQTFDEKNVAEEGRVAWVRPAQYNLLVRNQDAINKDWGGMGSYADGTILRIGGVEICKTNNLDSTDYTQPSGVNNTYTVDAQNTVCLVTSPEAVGTVKLQDVQFNAEWDIRTQTNLMVAKMIVGHGGLRPECAVEIRSADPS